MERTWLSPQIRGARLQRLLLESQWLVGWRHLQGPPFLPSSVEAVFTPTLWLPGISSLPWVAFGRHLPSTQKHAQTSAAQAAFPLSAGKPGSLSPALTEPGVLDSVLAFLFPESALFRRHLPEASAPDDGLPALPGGPHSPAQGVQDLVPLRGSDPDLWLLLSGSSPANPAVLDVTAPRDSPGHPPCLVTLPPQPPFPTLLHVEREPGGVLGSLSWGPPRHGKPVAWSPAAPCVVLQPLPLQIHVPGLSWAAPSVAWLCPRAQHRAKHTVSAWGVGGGQVLGWGSQRAEWRVTAGPSTEQQAALKAQREQELAASAFQELDDNMDGV